MRYLAFALFAVTINASASELACESLKSVSGWTGGRTNEKVHFSASFGARGELVTAKISGAYLSDTRNVGPDLNYRPRNPIFKDFNRFGPFEDAWHWFHVLLPKGASALGSGLKFPAYVQIEGEGGYIGTVKLACLNSK